FLAAARCTRSRDPPDADRPRAGDLGLAGGRADRPADHRYRDRRTPPAPMKRTLRNRLLLLCAVIALAALVLWFGWRDQQRAPMALTELDPDSITRIELTIAQGAPLVAHRADENARQRRTRAAAGESGRHAGDALGERR